MDLFIAQKLVDTQAMRFYKLLRDQIVSGGLPPGHELSERSISDQLNVGRTPIREALQKLAANGLVQVEPRRGTFVSPIDAEGTAELFYVVWPLEKLIMLRAGNRGRADELSRLAVLADRLSVRRLNGKPASFYFEVNELTAQAARNPYLVAVLEPMRMLVERVRIVCGLGTDRAVRLAFGELVAGVAARDGAGTEIAFDAYAELFQRKAVAHLKRKPIAQPADAIPHR